MVYYLLQFVIIKMVKMCVELFFMYISMAKLELCNYLGFCSVGLIQFLYTQSWYL